MLAVQSDPQTVLCNYTHLPAFTLHTFTDDQDRPNAWGIAIKKRSKFTFYLVSLSHTNLFKNVL